MRSRLVVTVAGGLLASTAPASAEVPAAVDLGTLAGSSGATFYSQADDINEAGQVVGWSLNLDDAPHAFLRSASGSMRDLGTLGGRRSEATAINERGRVVGFAHKSLAGSPPDHAFLWDGAMKDLGTLGGAESRAYGINASDRIVGWADNATGTSRALIRGPVGGMVDLGTLGGASSGASDINDAGQVAGGAATASGQLHAFRWDSVGGMLDLGTLGGSYSDAMAVNVSGHRRRGFDYCIGRKACVPLERSQRHGRSRPGRRGVTRLWRER